MKNKDKFVKIANIISKVLIGIMIALLVLCVGVVCFRACSADKYVAYANTRANVTDLTGTTWKWKEKLTPTSVDLFWEVSGVSDYFSFSRIDSTYLDSDGGNLLYYLDFDTDIKHLAYTSAVDDVVSEYFPDAIVGWQNEAVKFFSISGGTDAINTDLINYLYANAELQGGTTPEPSTYDLFIDITNGVSSHTSITSTETKTVQIQPNSGYTYPSSVSVTGCTLDSYNAETGVAVISNATGACRISGSCVVLPVVSTYSLYLDITNGEKYQTPILSNETKQFQITPNAGYTFPTSVTVINCTLVNYDSTTGIGSVSNATGMCRVSGVCPLQSNPTDAIRGQYIFMSDLSFSGISNNSLSVPVNFTTSNGGVVSSWGTFSIGYDNTNSVWLIAFSRVGSDVATVVYSSRDFGPYVRGWQNPQYQTVDFGNAFQSVPVSFVTWLNANVLPSNIQDSEAYQLGYNRGLEIGKEVGYDSGYSKGDAVGFKRGYDAGLAEGQNSALHGAEGVIAGTASLFDIKIFGAFSMLDMLLVVFGIGLAIWFLKMFAGG